MDSFDYFFGTLIVDVLEGILKNDLTINRIKR